MNVRIISPFPLPGPPRTNRTSNGSVVVVLLLLLRLDILVGISNLWDIRRADFIANLGSRKDDNDMAVREKNLISMRILDLFINNIMRQ